MPRGQSSGHARRPGAGLAVTFGLMVVACGTAPRLMGAPGPAPSPDASVGAAAPGSASGAGGPVAPLTGLPVSGADAGRPAVALVVTGSSPRGLTSADVVFQEFSTPVRYIAVYQSTQASGVGPVTSTQPTDRGALSVLHPLVGYDGAAEPYFVTLLDKAKVTDVSFEQHRSLYTATSQGVSASTRTIWRAAGRDTAPPPLFAYRGPGAEALAATGLWRPSSARVYVPGNSTQQWTFDPSIGRWRLASGGPAFQAANLVIQTVSYKDIHVRSKFGGTVRTAEVIGAGRAEVFSGSKSGGTAAIGSWSKPHLQDVTNYFGADWLPMAFQPGPTWVILAPRGTRVTSSR